MEILVRQQALKVGAGFLAKLLNADASDYAGAALPCRECGAPARYVDRRAKSFTTCLGDLTVERAYYHCAACGQGWCPKDDALGCGDAVLSPAVTRMVGLVAATDSFRTGAQLLQELAGVTVTAKCVERTAKALGEAIAQDELTCIDEKLNPSSTMYAGVDGTGVPMRPTEVAGRAGKQPDGTAKTREVKQCVVWTADARDAQGNPSKDPGSVSYSAAIESCAWSPTYNDTPPFAARVERELTRRGYFQAPQQVFLGDGAAWIWNLAALVAPHALQIVDLYHAKEHLSQLAGAIFGTPSDLAQQWAADRYAELESGDLDAVLHAISSHTDRPGTVGKQASREFEYFHSNRHRMRYADFRSLGLCVGSGVVEAGCKVVIAQRLKRSGMFWSLQGANAIIALRCYLLSGTFDAFWVRYRANHYRVPQPAIA
jgi:hypothetical protein